MKIRENELHEVEVVTKPHYEKVGDEKYGRVVITGEDLFCKCTVCYEKWEFGKDYNYCPYCGARLKEVGND